MNGIDGRFSLQAFTNMTQMIRRALCAVMVFAAVPYEGTVVMKDGEELDSWSVILNGEVQVTYCDGSEQHLVMGDRCVVCVCFCPFMSWYIVWKCCCLCDCTVIRVWYQM